MAVKENSNFRTIRKNWDGFTAKELKSEIRFAKRGVADLKSAERTNLANRMGSMHVAGMSGMGMKQIEEPRANQQPGQHPSEPSAQEVH